MARSTATRKWVDFELKVEPGAKVFIAGTFNDWDGSAMPLHAQANGSWAVALTLPPGTYEYQFVVDGCWMPDPKARESVPNPYGGVNSILRVPAEA